MTLRLTTAAPPLEQKSSSFARSLVTWTAIAATSGALGFFAGSLRAPPQGNTQNQNAVASLDKDAASKSPATPPPDPQFIRLFREQFTTHAATPAHTMDAALHRDWIAIQKQRPELASLTFDQAKERFVAPLLTRIQQNLEKDAATQEHALIRLKRAMDPELKAVKYNAAASNMFEALIPDDSGQLRLQCLSGSRLVVYCAAQLLPTAPGDRLAYIHTSGHIIPAMVNSQGAVIAVESTVLGGTISGDFSHCGGKVPFRLSDAVLTEALTLLGSETVNPLNALLINNVGPVSRIALGSSGQIPFTFGQADTTWEDVERGLRPVVTGANSGRSHQSEEGARIEREILLYPIDAKDLSNPKGIPAKQVLSGEDLIELERCHFLMEAARSDLAKLSSRLSTAQKSIITDFSEEAVAREARRLNALEERARSKSTSSYSSFARELPPSPLFRSSADVAEYFATHALSVASVQIAETLRKAGYGDPILTAAATIEPQLMKGYIKLEEMEAQEQGSRQKFYKLVDEHPARKRER